MLGAASGNRLDARGQAPLEKASCLLLAPLQRQAAAAPGLGWGGSLLHILMLLLLQGAAASASPAKQAEQLGPCCCCSADVAVVVAAAAAADGSEHRSGAAEDWVAAAVGAGGLKGLTGVPSGQLPPSLAVVALLLPPAADVPLPPPVAGESLLALQTSALSPTS